MLHWTRGIRGRPPRRRPHHRGPPLPLHEHVGRAVHHDFGDLGVPEEPLDGAEADDLVRYLVDQTGQLAYRQHHPVLAEDA